MTTHTPGPWEYRPFRYDDWGFVRGPRHPAGDQPLVACARSGCYETEAELAEHRRNKTDPYEANARLIAAAPDMLAALKDLARFCDAVRVQVGMGKTQLARLEQARAAIAKAEGGGK